MSGDRAADRGFSMPAVNMVELPIDDSWLRDSGPTHVLDAAARNRNGGPSPSMAHMVRAIAGLGSLIAVFAP